MNIRKNYRIFYCVILMLFMIYANTSNAQIVEFSKQVAAFKEDANIQTIANMWAEYMKDKSFPAALMCSIVYFGLMFFAGWYYGSKDAVENEIHDIGFRFHFITYVLCIALGYASYFIGWNTEPLRSLNIGAMSWGIGLALHFVFFLFAQKNAIRGYAKEEIFQ